jgi:hypothetical protein
LLKKVILTLLILLVLVCPVFAGGLPKATLSWEPPSTNEDGTPLTDLRGYIIYWGLSSGDYSTNRKIVVDNKDTLTVNIELNQNGNVFFVATAYNEAFIESSYSNEVSKYFDAVPKRPTVVELITD